MKPEAAIFKISTGELVMLGPADTQLRDGQGKVLLPTDYADQSHIWDKVTRTMIEDIAKIEAMLLSQIKAEAEARKMRVMSVGGAKKAEYAEKRNEVILWDSLGGTIALALLEFDKTPQGRRAVKFAHAIADSAAFGDKPADAIERFRTGMKHAESAPVVSAIEARTCAAIRAATTAAAKRAAAVVTWPAA